MSKTCSNQKPHRTLLQQTLERPHITNKPTLCWKPNLAKGMWDSVRRWTNCTAHSPWRPVCLPQRLFVYMFYPCLESQATESRQPTAVRPGLWTSHSLQNALVCIALSHQTCLLFMRGFGASLIATFTKIKSILLTLKTISYKHIRSTIWQVKIQVAM